MNKYRLFLKEVILNYSNTIIAMSLTFILVPITIHLLGEYKYGVWVLLLSFISWFNIADFGLGNSLRNHITSNFDKDNRLVNQYITTSFIIIFIISLLMLTTLYLIIANINIDFFFKDLTINKEELKNILFIFVFGISINFMLSIFKSIALAVNKSYWVIQMQVLSNILILLYMLIIKYIYKSTEIDLLEMCIVYISSITFTNLILSLRVLHLNSIFIPNIKKFDSKLISNLFYIGTKFFILQIAGLLIFSTDTVIISKYFGSVEVTMYSIIDKIFITGNTLFSILLIALWSTVSKAKSDLDYSWLNTLIKKMWLAIIIYLFGVVIIGVNINFLIELWLQKPIIYENKLILAFVFYNILLSITGVYTNVSNGLNKLNVQLGLMIFAALINIPLSIYLGVYMGFGVAGVKYATIIVSLPLLIILPVYLHSHLKKEGKYIASKF